MNEEESLFITGDFLGNLVIQDNAPTSTFSPRTEIFTYQPLRCLEWSPYNPNLVFSGHMGGSVLMINLETQLSQEVFKIHATITAIRFNRELNLLLIGSTIGVTYVFKVVPETHELIKIAQH